MNIKFITATFIFVFFYTVGFAIENFDGNCKGEAKVQYPYGQNDAEFRGEAKTKIAILFEQNTENKKRIDSIEDDIKNVDEYKSIIDRQDKRIEDVNAKMASVANYSAWLAAFLAIWAIIITVLSIIIPIVYVPRWKDEAVKEAVNSANDAIGEMKTEVSIYVMKSADNLLQEKIKQIDNYVELSKQRLEAISETHDDYIRAKEQMDNKRLSQYEQIKTDENSLLSALEYALQKAKAKNSFGSWFDVAQFEYKLKDYKNAIQHFDQAIALTDDLDLIYIANFNKACAFGRLGEVEKAIKIYYYLLQTGHDDLDVYTNLFEMQVVNGDQFDENLIKEFEEKSEGEENKVSRLQYAALKTIKNSYYSDQIEKINELKEEFKNVNFGDWSWIEIDGWVKNIVPEDTKNRVMNCIDVFKQWKS